MSETLLVAGVAAATSLVVSVLGPWVGRLVESGRERRLLITAVNLQHLAPLRQQLADTTFRNRQILDRIRRGDTALLTSIENASELREKTTEWFARDGHYLTSSSYYTAKLFAEMVRLREAFPFLRLQQRLEDTELTALVLRIRLAFAGRDGVFYTVQEEIGEDMLMEGGRVAGFGFFIAAVRNEERGVWYAQLVQFYRSLAGGQNVDRLERAVAAMESLSDFLDRAVGASASVSARLRLEAEAQTWRRLPGTSPALTTGPAVGD